ncbi:MAG: SRPBCC family protein [Bdellovibrionales bacterium]
MKRRLFILLSLWSFLAAGQTFTTVEPEKAPFWRRKEKLWARMLEERHVVVAVKTQKSKLTGFKEELYLQGAGVTAAPMALTEQVGRRFEDYPKISSFVKSASYVPETRILTMHTQAFNYSAHLKMRLRFEEPSASKHEIRFQVIAGKFSGLTGVVSFEDLGSSRTLTAITGQMGFHKLPMPVFFVEFGLEVALRLMATKMRAFAEAEFSRGKKSVK